MHSLSVYLSFLSLDTASPSELSVMRRGGGGGRGGGGRARIKVKKAVLRTKSEIVKNEQR